MASERIPQSVAYLALFRAFLASDGKTPATGKTIAITISKNGGAFGNPNAGATNATEISSGFYKFTLDTTDTGTLGPLAWRGAEAAINDAGDILTIAKATNGGFSSLPDAVAGANTGLPLGDASGRVDVGKWLGTAASTPTVAGVPNVNAKTWNDLATVALPLIPATPGRSLVVDAAGLADATAVKVGPSGAATAQTAGDLPGRLTATRAGYLDNLSAGAVALESSLQGLITTIGASAAGVATAVWGAASRTLSAAGVQAIWDALTSALTTSGSIGKWILDKLNVVLSTRAIAGDAMTLTSGERTAIANEVEAQIIDDTDSEKVLTAITDKIASVNPSLGGLTLAAIASQVRTELSVELARIDAAISSRSTYAGGDTSGVTSLLSRLTATRAGYLDNLSPGAVPTAAGIASAVRTELSTELGRLDAAVTTRLATAGYTAPANSTIASIAAAIVSTALEASVQAALTALASVPSAATLAAAVRSDLNNGAPIPANMRAVNDVTITGMGIEGSDEWRPA